MILLNKKDKDKQKEQLRIEHVISSETPKEVINLRKELLVRFLARQHLSKKV